MVLTILNQGKTLCVVLCVETTIEEIAKRRLYIQDGLLTMVDGQTIYPNAPF